jgi:flavin reductase (DIM6/NTAB) family NADH-FMN oxidoreductase RutF
LATTHPDRDRESTVDDASAYEILRNLSSPIVALTCREGEKLNGMIANSAIRASIVPGHQRVANYVFKRHLTHDMMARTGRYVLHLLAREQWKEIWALGFQAGREIDKFADLDFELTSGTGLPVLPGAYAWMECEVVNVMDAGASTFFMGEILKMERGTGAEVMDSAHFRANMPEAWRDPYLRNLEAVQAWAARNAPPVDDRPWRELQTAASGGEG